MKVIKRAKHLSGICQGCQGNGTPPSLFWLSYAPFIRYGRSNGPQVKIRQLTSETKSWCNTPAEISPLCKHLDIEMLKGDSSRRVVTSRGVEMRRVITGVIETLTLRHSQSDADARKTTPGSKIERLAPEDSPEMEFLKSSTRKLVVTLLCRWSNLPRTLLNRGPAELDYAKLGSAIYSYWWKPATIKRLTSSDMRGGVIRIQRPLRVSKWPLEQDEEVSNAFTSLQVPRLLDYVASPHTPIRETDLAFLSKLLWHLILPWKTRRKVVLLTSLKAW